MAPRVRKSSAQRKAEANFKRQVTREIRRRLIPGYGRKGRGLINDPERAIKGALERRVIGAIKDLFRKF